MLKNEAAATSQFEGCKRLNRLPALDSLVRIHQQQCCVFGKMSVK